ncbi:MAG: hypothetical protein ABFR65_04785 [Pseudomonadota bacterium]
MMAMLFMLEECILQKDDPRYSEVPTAFTLGQAGMFSVPQSAGVMPQG